MTLGLIARLKFERLDSFLTGWMAHVGVQALRISVGIVFFWFGFLKFFPGVSSAETLAINTTQILTFGIISNSIALWLIAMLEVTIGLGLIFGVYLRAVLLLLWLQMVGAISPLILFPHETFTNFPWVPTLEGQYIIKNLVLISAGIVVGATVRGGKLVAEPRRQGRQGRQGR